ncbi:MAG: hypothetical protein JXA43_03680 [Candidatus Diapherotrites archaeon]|nr:hypothetical protein [Candidatus Diapherotrites archaeon]
MAGKKKGELVEQVGTFDPRSLLGADVENKVDNTNLENNSGNESDLDRNVAAFMQSQEEKQTAVISSPADTASVENPPIYEIDKKEQERELQSLIDQFEEELSDLNIEINKIKGDNTAELELQKRIEDLTHTTITTLYNSPELTGLDVSDFSKKVATAKEESAKRVYELNKSLCALTEKSDIEPESFESDFNISEEDLELDDEESNSLSEVGSNDFIKAGIIPPKAEKVPEEESDSIIPDTTQLDESKLEDATDEFQITDSDAKSVPIELPSETETKPEDDPEKTEMPYFIGHGSSLSEDFNNEHAKLVEKINKCKSPEEEVAVFTQVIANCDDILKSAGVNSEEMLQTKDFANDVVSMKRKYTKKLSDAQTKLEEKQTFAELFGQGTKCVANKDFDGAIEAFEKALEINPDNTTVQRAIKGVEELKNKEEKGKSKKSSKYKGLSALIGGSKAKKQPALTTEEESATGVPADEAEKEVDKEVLPDGTILLKPEAPEGAEITKEFCKASPEQIKKSENVNYAKYFNTTSGKNIGKTLTALDKRLRKSIKENEEAKNSIETALAVLDSYKELTDFMNACKTQVFATEKIQLEAIKELGELVIDGGIHAQDASEVLFNAQDAEKAINTGDLNQIAEQIKKMDETISDPEKVVYAELSKGKRKELKRKARKLIKKFIKKKERDLLKVKTAKNKTQLLNEIGFAANLLKEITGKIDDDTAISLANSKAIAVNQLRTKAIEEHLSREKETARVETLESFIEASKEKLNALENLPIQERRQQIPKIAELQANIKLAQEELEALNKDISKKTRALKQDVTTLVSLGVKPTSKDILKLSKVMDTSFIPESELDKVLKDSINLSYEYAQISKSAKQSIEASKQVYNTMVKLAKARKEEKSGHEIETLEKKLEKQTALLNKILERENGKELDLLRVDNKVIEKYRENVAKQQKRIEKIRTLEEARIHLENESKKLEKKIAFLEKMLKESKDREKENAELVKILTRERKELKKAQKEAVEKIKKLAKIEDSELKEIKKLAKIKEIPKKEDKPDKKISGKQLLKFLHAEIGKALEKKGIRWADERKLREARKNIVKKYNEIMTEIPETKKRANRIAEINEAIKIHENNKVIIAAKEARLKEEKARLQKIKGIQSKIVALKNEIKGLMSEREKQEYIELYNKNIIFFQKQQAEINAKKLKAYKKQLTEKLASKDKKVNKKKIETDIKKIDNKLARYNALDLTIRQMKYNLGKVQKMATTPSA